MQSIFSSWTSAVALWIEPSQVFAGHAFPSQLTASCAQVVTLNFRSYCNRSWRKKQFSFVRHVAKASLQRRFGNSIFHEGCAQPDIISSLSQGKYFTEVFQSWPVP